VTIISDGWVDATDIPATNAPFGRRGDLGLYSNLY
jgi:hypothetical protein